jgi:hypothetical protein
MTFTHSIDRAGVTVRFPAKPDDSVRSMLKAHGFRWSPQAGLWWRRRIAGAADFLAALDRKLNPGRPDGACWECGNPCAYFRNEGAAAPVRCDACQAKRTAPDPTDLVNEDACRQACGL